MFEHSMAYLGCGDARASPISVSSAFPWRCVGDDGRVEARLEWFARGIRRSDSATPDGRPPAEAGDDSASARA